MEDSKIAEIIEGTIPDTDMVSKEVRSDGLSETDMRQILYASTLVDKEPAETLSKERAKAFVSGVVGPDKQRTNSRPYIKGIMLACAASIMAAVLILTRSNSGDEANLYAESGVGIPTEIVESQYAAADVFNREIVMIAPDTDSCNVSVNKSRFEYLLEWKAVGVQYADIVIKDDTDNTIMEVKNIDDDKFKICIDNIHDINHLVWHLSVRYSDGTTAQKTGLFNIIKI